MGRREEFFEECLKTWKAAITSVAGSNPPDSLTWRGLDRILDAIQPVMGANRNHAHLPTGGGFDFQEVEYAAESNCLSFTVEERMADIINPLSLTLEYFPKAPLESFLLLELDTLTATGVNKYPSNHKEEVIEYPRGTYLSRDLWEDGYLAHDENGREIPLPPESRLVTRWFGGKVLFVAKGSLWNGDPGTYDGRHNVMTAAQIRKVIEGTLQKRSEANSR